MIPNKLPASLCAVTFQEDVPGAAGFLGRTCLLPLNSAASGTLAPSLHFSSCCLCSSVCAGLNKHSHRACFFRLHPSPALGLEVPQMQYVFSPESCLEAPDLLFSLPHVKGRPSLQWLLALPVLNGQSHHPGGRGSWETWSLLLPVGQGILWSPVHLCLLSPRFICLLSSSLPLSSPYFLQA